MLKSVARGGGAPRRPLLGCPPAPSWRFPRVAAASRGAEVPGLKRAAGLAFLRFMGIADRCELAVVLSSSGGD